MTDPRHYQIATLASLLAYGLLALDFDVSWIQVGLTLGAALAAQAYGDLATADRLTSGWKSALISGLSLCLLLRTNDPPWAAAAAVVAVGSKFVIRLRGKHVFNPTNLALAAMMLATRAVWVSPGQWGNEATAAFFFACAGMLVVYRAARSDVTWAFLASYALLLFARSLWLGEPLAIPLHRLENGALLLFSFFMISDPKTTPDSRAGRILFAALVACGAWYVQFRLFRTNGLIWSLVVCSCVVPLIDRVLPGQRYHWPAGRLTSRWRSRPGTRVPVPPSPLGLPACQGER